MLLVKAIGHRQRQLAELIAHAVQRLAAKTQYAAQAAAGDLPFRHFAGAAAAVIAESQARRVAAGRDRFHLIAVVALHQGQAVGEGDGIGVAVLLGYLNAHQLVEFADQLIALIEQRVRFAAGAAAQAGNLIVKTGNLLAIAVNLLGGVVNLLINAAIHVAQIFIGIIKLVNQAVSLAQHRLARRVVAGVAHQVLQIGEKILQAARQGIGFAG